MFWTQESKLIPVLTAEKIMKTFESIVVRRKLASFRPIFPHHDRTSVKNIEGIYGDVLEFSRPVAVNIIFVNLWAHEWSFQIWSIFRNRDTNCMENDSYADRKWSNLGFVASRW
jgi:hypothetical protein